MPLLLQQDAPSTPWQWIVFVGWLCGEALSLVFVTRVLTRGGAPASTLLWVIVILGFPYLGLGLYYLFPRRLQARRLRRRQNRLAWIEPDLERLRPIGGDGDPAALQARGPVERLLRRIDADGVHDGNGVRWLPLGDDFFAAATSAIAAARRFVHVEVYIFRADGSGRLMLDALVAAARRGVEVRLLYDYFGSLSLTQRDLQPLLAAGGKAVAFLPLLWRRRPLTLNLRNHRKLFVIDGELALIGGRNVGDEYVSGRQGRVVWHDAMLQIDGPAVGRLHRVFVEDWYYAAEEDLAEERYFPEVGPRGSATVGVLLSGPDRERQGMWYVLFQLVNSAEQSIELSSPYLVPPQTLLFALKVAAARGVQVRLHTNGHAVEAMVLYRAQRSYYADLLDAGIEVYETVDEYNHAKVVVVDERVIAVGSANFDMRSAHLNYELGVAVPDAAVAAAVLATLAERRQRCRKVERQDLRGNLPRKLLEGACRLLSPLL